MKIRTTLLFGNITLFLLVGVYCTLSFMQLRIAQDISNSADQLVYSIHLAAQLKQSSDDLTRMARIYVSTGDLKYRYYFNKILDIRNGESPRPDNYGGIFWDKVLAYPETPINWGTIVTLKELMSEAGFSDEELTLLNEAKDRSTELAELEEIAMNAVMGRFTDNEGKFSRRGISDQDWAISIIFGHQYHIAKYKIMVLIDQFNQNIDERLKSKMNRLHKSDRQIVAWQIIIGLVTIILLVFSLFYTGIVIFTPLKRLIEGAGSLHNNNYSVRIKVIRKNEISDLGGTFNLMASAIEQDLTNREKNTKRLREAMVEAETATKAKSDFLANMSHEIRTPMNAIIGLGSLLEKTKLTAKQNDYITKIRKSSVNLLGIINDILDFSKIEAGKLDIEETNFVLNDVLENLFSMIGSKVNDKNIELIFNQDMDTPLNLVGDPLRLGQILLNLTNNAIKFTDKGEIEISTKLIQKDKEEALLRFEIRDTGIGLTPKQKDKLFQSFSQADSSITRKYGGTGLGLTISKHLSEMMGGEIGVISEYEKGSTFFFTIKFKIGENKVKLIAPKDIAGMKVLIVDDNITALDVLRAYLEDFSLKVTTVTSGKLAINELMKVKAEQGRKYDLILMDYQMPEMNGLEASSIIRKTLGNVDLPKIIMITSFGREEILSQVQDMGLDGFLIKPIGPSILLDTIMEVFGKSSKLVKRKKLEEMRPEGFNTIIGAKILLVEDNEINQQVAIETLMQEGFRVDIASNGIEAVEIMSTDYDVVLMDLQMPEMDGFEATRAIRKDSRYNDIAIIAMTADAMTGVREKVIEAGMNDYVTKPIDPKELWRALIKWVKPGKRDIPKDFKNKTENLNDTIIIPEIAGLDIIDGLSRVIGNKILYKSLILKFTQDFVDSPEEIRRKLEEKDTASAERIAHTIKGVSGNIGAKKLQEKAEHLEKAIKEKKNENYKVLLSDLQESLEELIHAINEAGLEEEKKNTSTKELSPDKFLHLLGELKQYLKKQRPKKCTPIIEEIEEYALQQEYATDFNELKKLIKKYRFKDSLEILERLMNMFPDKDEKQLDT